MSIISISNTLPNIINLPGQGGGGTAFSSTKSLEFDGIDDYVDTGINTASTDFSFSCWVKHSGTFAANYKHIVFCSLTTSNIQYGGFCCYHSTGTDLVLGVWNNMGTTQLGTGWNHIMGVWDDTTKTCELYLNGALELTYTVAAYGDISRTLEIGDLITGNYAGNFDAWNGNIDEFAYWTSKLTLSDAISIYNSGTPADLTSLSPVSWYRMGENSTFKTPQILMPENTNKDKVSNYSMAFDGISDYISLSSVIPLGVLSVSFWMKSSDTATGSITNGLGNISFIGTTPLLRQSAHNYKYFADQVANFDGNWHHWFVLIAGSGTSDISNARMFVDGVELAAGTIVAGGSPSAWTTADIGKGHYGYKAAILDEFAIWDSDQTANVATISASPLNDLTSLSPVAYWKMGEEATFVYGTPPDGVWTIPDQIGSNDGTSANMTIEDRVGDAKDSSNNALSYNMDAADIDPDTPPN